MCGRTLRRYWTPGVGTCVKWACPGRSWPSPDDDRGCEKPGSPLERRRNPSVDADKLLNRAPTPGVLRYCELHDQNIAGATPYAQIAIEYEVEMLPLRYGERFVSHCLDVLGPEILPCLSFVTEHIVLDAGHTDFNARAIAKLLDLMPTCLPALVSAGTAILDAYAQFLTDCAQLAERASRQSRPLTYARSRPLMWQMHSPLYEGLERGELVAA